MSALAQDPDADEAPITADDVVKAKKTQQAFHAFVAVFCSIGVATLLLAGWSELSRRLELQRALAVRQAEDAHALALSQSDSARVHRGAEGVVVEADDAFFLVVDGRVVARAHKAR